MLKACLTIAACLLVWLTASTGAQQAPTATKFDDFGDVLYSDLIARLDNFATQLMNQPNTMGLIVVYRTRRDLPGLSHALAMRSKDYLVRTRGIARDRVKTVDGGVAEHLAQELWIVPPGSAPEPRKDARIGLLQNPEAAWKFYEHGFLPLDQHKRFGVKHDPEIEAEQLEAYANEVKKSPDRSACIIVYAQYNLRRPASDWSGTYEPIRERALDPGNTARKELNRQKEILIRVYGLPAKRIKLIDGGYRKRRSIELWIVPAGEPLPIPTPDAFPFGKRRK
jgi:hypothetical protein